MVETLSGPPPVLAIVDLSTGTPVTRSAHRAARVERFTSDDVADPTRTAASLTRLHALVHETTAPSRAQPRGLLFRGVTVGAAGAKVRLAHGFGGPVFFTIKGWHGASTTAAPILVADDLDTSGRQTDSTTLVLRSYVAGVVDLLLEEVP